jgi:cytochrome c553
MVRWGALWLLAATAGATAQDAPVAPARLGLCVACHGADGRGRTPETPHIGGQHEAYLRAALAAYRDGTRASAAMNAIAGSLGAADIETLARWYALQRWPATDAPP